MNMTKEHFESIVKSYITKEEFINLLVNLDFKTIEDFDINVITDFYIEVNEKEEPRVKKLGFHIGGS